MKLLGCLPLCLGMFSTGCILPFLQRGQSVISMPVSFSINLRREAVILSNLRGHLSKRMRSVKLAVRLRLAKKP